MLKTNGPHHACFCFRIIIVWLFNARPVDPLKLRKVFRKLRKGRPHSGESSSLNEGIGKRQKPANSAPRLAVPI